MKSIREMKEFLAESEKDVYYHGEDMFSELLAWAEKARAALLDYRENVCDCRVIATGRDVEPIECQLCEDTTKLLTELPEADQ